MTFLHAKATADESVAFASLSSSGGAKGKAWI